MYIDSRAFAAGLELVEDALPVCEAATSEYPADLAFDRMLQLRDLCSESSKAAAEDYVARKAADFTQRLEEFADRRDPARGSRTLGIVKALVQDKFYGFIRVGAKDYFFHIRDLPTQEDWHALTEGASVAFRPIDHHPKGPRAGEPTLLD